MLQRVVPRPEPYTIAHRSIYHVHQRVAKSFRHGRVLLAGDAAHVNNPLGGMGMNGGIQDAFNLADKLKAIWAGADDRLLDRYDRQRRTVAVEAVQQQTHRNQQIISERDPGDAEEIARRDAEGRGRQDIGARIHAAVVDDREHAAGGGDRVADLQTLSDVIPAERSREPESDRLAASRINIGPLAGLRSQRIAPTARLGYDGDEPPYSFA